MGWRLFWKITTELKSSYSKPELLFMLLNFLLLYTKSRTSYLWQEKGHHCHCRLQALVLWSHSEGGADLVCLLTWYFTTLLIGCYATSVRGKGETKLIVSVTMFVFSCRYNSLYYTKIHVKISSRFLTYFDRRSCQRTELNFTAWQQCREKRNIMATSTSNVQLSFSKN